MGNEEQKQPQAPQPVTEGADKNVAAPAPVENDGRTEVDEGVRAKASTEAERAERVRLASEQN